MKYDVTSLGELVIDLIPAALAGEQAYLAKPGGAPANVAAGLARLGFRSAMISKVGTEAFGQAAVAALAATGVSVDAVIRSPAFNTALAVVAPPEASGSGFFFYRENCADSNLTADEIPTELIRGSAFLHVGTLLLATPDSAAAQRRAIAVAKESGVLVSADPNFRELFWRDRGRMQAAGLEVVQAASVVKVSQEELTLLTGSADTRDAARSLWHPGLIAFAVTKGAGGADLFSAAATSSVPGFPVTEVDATGCGDAFMATLLAGLLQHGSAPLDARALHSIGTECCAAGALMATCNGALESMPTRAMISEFVRLRGPGRDMPHDSLDTV